MKKGAWPENAARYALRKADDRRFFIYDMAGERRCSGLIIDRHEAEHALHALNAAARRQP